jgi:hypothetical protein
VQNLRVLFSAEREFLRAAREVAKEAQKVLKEAKAKLSEEEQQRISADANDSTLEDLEEQEAIIKARINAGRNVDQGILEDYNRRKASVGIWLSIFVVQSS